MTDEAPRWSELVSYGHILQTRTFPPLRWAVEGLIPEGLSLLVGAPKVGKSWLALDLALAVASGGKALSGLPVDQGDVLYLALEDSDRRLQDRIRLLLGDEPFPQRFQYATRWPKSTEGATWAHEWLADHPDARLLIVDTLARVRGQQTGRGSAYDEDTASLVPWQRVAEKYRVAVVLLHHDRKAQASDFIDNVSGTHGLAGVADTTIVLDRARMEDYGVIRLTGRDVLEHEVALRRAGPAWVVHDGALPDPDLGATSSRILALASVATEGIRAADVVTELDVSNDTAKRYLARLAESGRLIKRERGLYLTPVPTVPTVPSDDGWGTYTHSLGTQETEETATPEGGCLACGHPNPDERTRLHLPCLNCRQPLTGEAS